MTQGASARPQQQLQASASHGQQIGAGAFAFHDGKQVFESIDLQPAFAIEEHLQQFFAHLGGITCQQALGHIGVSHLDDFEIRIQSQGQALLAHHGANDQGKACWHPEGIGIHQLREPVGDRLEIEGPHVFAEGPTEHLLQGGHDRFEVSFGVEEAQAHKVVGQGAKVAVDQVHHGPGEGEAIAVADRIHHPEVHVGHMAQGSGFAR